MRFKVVRRFLASNPYDVPQLSRAPVRSACDALCATGGADEAAIGRGRFLANQARDPAPHYEHSQLGFNYRMSNVLAAVGRGQLRVLADRVAARRRNFDWYRAKLGGLPGLAFMPEAGYGQATRWLTCLTIDPEEFGATREEVRLALEAENIESRPAWKPLHMQPVFAGCRSRGGAVARELFERGLCLPSGSSLTDADRERVVGIVREVHRASFGSPLARRASEG